MIDDYADRWAVVTGASSGIGAEFARQLAGRGMHLVIAARREERLADLATELERQHGTNTRIVVADLATDDGRKRLEDAIADIECELLVNNAGVGLVGAVDAVNRDDELRLVRLNIEAVVALTRLVLPKMRARGHGAVLNVASVAAFQPVAYMACYAASKAFVLHYSEGLWAELRDSGVTVTAICPGVTRTEFFEVANAPGYLEKQRAHSPERVVRTALRSLQKKRSYRVVGKVNYLLSLAARLASRKMAVLGSRKFFRPKSEAAESDDPERLNAASPSSPSLNGSTAESAPVRPTTTPPRP